MKAANDQPPPPSGGSAFSNLLGKKLAGNRSSGPRRHDRR